MTNEELEQEVKRPEEQITNLRIKILESKVNKKPYEVEVPEDIDDYYYTNEYGRVDYLGGYNTSYEKNKYIHGLAFKTKEEAEKYDKECILLFKLHKWAEENKFHTRSSWCETAFSKLPHFISNDIAEQFIEEFGEDIKEVLC